jgi:hypothetical protein
MYKKFTKIKKNTIEIDVCSFRDLINDDDNHDKLIQTIINVNRKILKKYKTFNYVISMETVSIVDICYCNFFKNLILQVQDIFKDELEVLYLTDTTEIFRNLFSYISCFIKQNIMLKIQFS